MDFENLQDPELLERLRQAKTPEDLLTLAQEFGVDLDDAQLEAISGGAWCSDYCTDFYYCRNDGPL
ncbi:MAG: Nif11-like leader peptide family natural product precursor [Atopobiaceae bacterium]|nr:Nif11-like leader peptide family natural product precursor [Atopobiaceae bacterium]